MKRILHTYANNVKRKYYYTGHLFENRYTACLVEDEKYFVKATDFLPITDGFACPFVDGYNDHVIKLRRKKGYPLNGNVSDHGTRDTPVLKRHGYCILISS